MSAKAENSMWMVAFRAILSLHSKDGNDVCMECGQTYPCMTTKVAVDSTGFWLNKKADA